MNYIHQKAGWPQFKWDEKRMLNRLVEIGHKQGRLIGRMEGLGFSLQNEATLMNMTSEVIKSSEIEGEILDHDQVRSSIARRLGMDIAGLVPSDRSVDGVVEVMIDATQHFKETLTEERLFNWHAALFPTGRSGMQKIVVGAWRDNNPDSPMQVVSGPLGKEKVHFEAPESKRLKKEMKQFLDWLNKDDKIHPVLKAGIAHFWFVTIHPFDDGNGRLTRTITDMLLARADNTNQRFYSISAQIRQERKTYYEVLEASQKSDLDITAWLDWFLDCLERSLDAAEKVSSIVLRKARYWELFATKTLNDRQRAMVNKLLDEDFFGKLTTSKWAKMNKCSTDTALRDINDLISQGVLEKEEAGGRSAGYRLINIAD
ncbi:MAG: Fic family protein [Bacteroidetes bacterium]|nr:Fic family protein [Bacteroidota bacterium]